VKRLICKLTFTGWKLCSPNERLHWTARRRASKPPLQPVIEYRSADAVVGAPHPRRTVVIVRYGPRTMDKDNLYASVKGVVDWLKGVEVYGKKIPGLIFDDSPTYINLIVKQAKGPYAVVVSIYEGR
jgi:hypothetical protein